jgi:hypothetical protein
MMIELSLYHFPRSIDFHWLSRETCSLQPNTILQLVTQVKFVTQSQQIFTATCVNIPPKYTNGGSMALSH